MRNFLTQERLQELSQKLRDESVGVDPAVTETVLLQAAAAAVASYRQWLQSDSGAE